MTPGRVFVHSMCTDNSNFLPIIEQLLHFLVRLTELGTQTLDKHSGSTRHDLQSLIGRIEQIPEFLVVDFQI